MDSDATASGSSFDEDSGSLVAVAGVDAKAEAVPDLEAYIGQNTSVDAARVTMISRSTIDADTLGRGTADGIVGIGEVRSFTVADPTIRTGVRDGADVTAADTIVINSFQQHSDDGPGLRARSTSPGVGLVNVNGAFAVVNGLGDMDTFVESGAAVTAGDSIAIRSDSTYDADAHADASTIGLLAGVGTSRAVTVIEGLNNAHLDGQASSIPGSTGTDLTIVTDNIHNANSLADAATGGILIADQGADADAVTRSSTSAYLGDNAVVDVTGDVLIDGGSRLNAAAEADSSVWGALSLGETRADSRVVAPNASTPNAAAYLGQDALVFADGSVTVRTGNASNGAADATVAGGGVVSGIGARSDARSNPVIDTRMEIGARIVAGGDVLLRSSAVNDAGSRSDGDSVGFAAAATSEAFARANGTTRTVMESGANVRSTGGDVAIEADANDVADADALASSAGVIQDNARGAETFAEVDATVEAVVSGGVSADVGHIDVLASSVASTNGNSVGTTSSGLVVAGRSRARAVMMQDVTAQVVNGSSLSAPDGDVTIRALQNRNRVTGEPLDGGRARTTAFGSNSDGASFFAAQAAETVTWVDAEVNVEIGAGAIIQAGRDVTAESLASNDLRSLADADRSSNFGIVSKGQALASGEIDNDNAVRVGQSAFIFGGRNVTLSARSHNDGDEVYADVGSIGLVNDDAARATSDISNFTNVIFFNNARVNAVGTVQAESVTDLDAESAAVASGAAFESDTAANAVGTVFNIMTTFIHGGVNIDADVVRLISRVDRLDVDVRTFAEAIGGSIDATAISTLDVLSFADVIFGTGNAINVRGTSQIEMIARQDNATTLTRSEAEITGGDGDAFALSRVTETNMRSIVVTSDNTNLTTHDLDVNTFVPFGSIVTQTDSAADADTATNFFDDATGGVFGLDGDDANEVVENQNFNSNITLDGNVFMIGVSPRLEIDSAGNIVEATGVTAQRVGDRIVVSDIINDGDVGTITLDSQGGDISGDATIHSQTTWDDVEIINRSDLDLLINDIQVFNRNAGPPIVELILDYDIEALLDSLGIFNSLLRASFGPILQLIAPSGDDNTNFTFDRAATISDVVIRNTADADVIFTGDVSTPTGTLLIFIDGQGDIQANPFHELSAHNINITITGTAGFAFGPFNSPLNLELVNDGLDLIENPVIPFPPSSLRIDTTRGDGGGVRADISVTERAPQGSEPSVIDASGLIQQIVARHDVTLTGLSGALVVERPNGSQFTTPIDTRIVLDNITSQEGNVTITDLVGEALLGRIEAPNGAAIIAIDDDILDANGSGNVNVVAGSVNLQSATGSIGRLSGPMAGSIQIHQTDADTGEFIALAEENVDVVQVAGKLKIGAVESRTSRVFIQVLDTPDAGDDIELQNGGGISPLFGRVKAAGDVTLLAGDDVLINLLSVVEAGGQVGIRGAGGNAEGGVGATIDILGRLFSGDSFSLVAGGDHNDQINIAQVPVDEAIVVFAGAGDDTISLVPYIIGGGTTSRIDGTLNVLGQEGLDTIEAAFSDNMWMITADNAGSVIGDNPFIFSTIESLVGNDLEDTFIFEDGTRLSGLVDGRGGFDVLDYTDYTTEVTVDLANNFASNVDQGVFNIESVIGAVDPEGPPRVVEVLADSTDWTAPVLVDGFAIPVGSGADQLASLPWSNVNQLRVVFSEDVLSVDESDFEVAGVTGGPLAFTVSYDQTTFTATLELENALTRDAFTLTVHDTVTDLGGEALDGEWDNPTDRTDPGSDTFPSGDGVPGGDFAFRFNVLPGDVGGDGRVDAADLNALALDWQKMDVGLGGADFNGDGKVDAADLNALAINWQTSIE